uniref:Cysteine-rich PDZ-binding protein n=1 Tax=Triticum urartu TaxID=4572 RepID=A0A8R7V500_TRIUA
MVCTKCEKKLGKVIVPDKWKEGASNTYEGGGRKINENKLLSKKSRWTPYGNTKCIICKQQVHQDGKYCHTCAYSKGKQQTPFGTAYKTCIVFLWRWLFLAH